MSRELSLCLICRLRRERFESGASTDLPPFLSPEVNCYVWVVRVLLRSVEVMTVCFLKTLEWRVECQQERTWKVRLPLGKDIVVSFTFKAVTERIDRCALQGCCCVPFYSWSLRLTPLPPLPLPLFRLHCRSSLLHSEVLVVVLSLAAAELLEGTSCVFFVGLLMKCFREAITRAITWGGIARHVLPRAKLIKAQTTLSRCTAAEEG
jgi:hypothetical protein